jgi:threonine/homoserine/homoserine lactone efflux protein
MSAYIDGLLYGLLFVLALGPAFFALLQTALKHGFMRAMLVSLGVILMDSVFIALILLGFSRFLEIPEVRFWLGLLGAAVLTLFGVASWTRNTTAMIEEDKERSSALISFFLKGVVVNGLNPLIIIFWIGIIGAVANLGYSFGQQVWFFAGFISTVFLLDVIKAFAIVRLTTFISPRLLRNINRVVGILFIFFGLRILAYLVFDW